MRYHLVATKGKSLSITWEIRIEFVCTFTTEVLGIRKLELFNSALFGKCLWRLVYRKTGGVENGREWVSWSVGGGPL